MIRTLNQTPDLTAFVGERIYAPGTFKIGSTAHPYITVGVTAEFDDTLADLPGSEIELAVTVHDESPDDDRMTEIVSAVMTALSDRDGIFPKGASLELWERIGAPLSPDTGSPKLWTTALEYRARLTQTA